MPLSRVFNDLGAKSCSADAYKNSYATMFQFQELPPVDQLPTDIQDFIKKIEPLPPEQKIQEVQHFGNSRMTYKEEPDDTDGFKPFRQLTEKPQGDCEDFANFKAGLLSYAGFPRENIALVGGDAHYGKTSFGHAVAVVQHDGKDFVLDNNLRDAVQMKDHPTKEMTTGGITMPVSMNVDFAFQMSEGGGCDVRKPRTPSPGL